jgi:hypothetical protein
LPLDEVAGGGPLNLKMQVGFRHHSLLVMFNDLSCQLLL